MTKRHLNGLFKSYGNHIDPEKEEQLKRVKIEVENQVKKILDLTRTINHGNKERNLRKKSEVIFLIEDFQEQYESLYSLYENLREEVKKNVGGADDDSSSGSDSDSETYYSPREFSAGNSSISVGTSDTDNQEAENSDVEDTVLKDKLTSSSEVKKSMNLDSEFGGILKDLSIQGEETENMGQRLAQIEDLEGQVARLKLEISTLCTQKRELEEQVECKFDEAKQMKERISILEARILEIEATSKKNECQFFSLRKQYEDKEQQYISKISELGAQANNMQLELKTLKHEKGKLQGRLAEQYKDKEKQYLSRISELVAQANKMQLELNTLKNEKGESEARLAEQYNDKEQQYLSRISELVAQASNMQLELNTLKHQKGKSEGRLAEQHKDEEQHLSRISELVAHANNMQLGLNTLNHQKGELEGQLAGETKRWSSQIEGLMEQLNSLQQELVSVKNQKVELERELKKRTEETAEEKEGLKVKVNDLELEIQSLSRKKSDLEEEVKKKTHEAFQSNEEKENLNGKFSELQSALSDREDELSAEQKKSNACQDMMSMKIEEIKNLNNNLVTLEVELEKEKQESSLREDQLKEKNTELTMKIEENDNLKNKLETLEMELDKEKQESSLREDQLKEKNTELTNKIAHLQEKLLELEAVVSKLREENEQAEHKLSFSKSHFQLAERKVEEVAEEFRKQFEDKYRILSRRIRVAEQLHAENKECYLKAKDAYEQETKDLKERAGRTETGLENVKDMTVTANEVLTSLDSVALKFEECTTNFLNRISKASRELKFAKHWAMMKNKADLHVEENLDLLTSPAS